MERKKKLAPVYDLLGKKLEKLNLACEMMMFDFGDLKLHTQGLTRIVKDGDILTTTLDYQNWDGADDTQNDEWYFVERFRDAIVGGMVTSVTVCDTNDLRIELDNGIRIEVLVSNGYSHYEPMCEQWRFFKHRDKTYPHITVYNKEIDVYSE